MELPEINLKLETVHVRGGSMPLPTRKQLLKRVPRKYKKKLKKTLGEQGYVDWLNQPIKWVSGEIECLHSIDAVDAIIRMLGEELIKNQK